MDFKSVFIKTELEALELVNKLNSAIEKTCPEEMWGDLFEFHTTISFTWISWKDTMLWDSDNFHDDDDNQIPVERHVRTSMKNLLKSGSVIGSLLDIASLLDSSK